MQVSLPPGFVDAAAEPVPRFGDPLETCQELRSAKEGGHMRRRVLGQTGKEVKALFVARFVVVFGGQRVAQELVLRLGRKHRFNLFPPRLAHNLSAKLLVCSPLTALASYPLPVTRSSS